MVEDVHPRRSANALEVLQAAEDGFVAFGSLAQRLHDVLEILPVYVVLLSADYHVPFANRFFRERFGESHGKRCFEYLFGRTEPCEVCETYTVLKTNRPQHWEWMGPDGRNYDIFDFPFTDTDGSPLIMEAGVDITERKRAEDALREAHEILEVRVQQRTAELAQANARLLAEIQERHKVEQALRESQADLNRAQAVAHTGSWRLDVQRNELLWSDETHRVFGIPKGTSLTYEVFLATVHPDDRELVDRAWQAALRGEPYDIEHRVVVKESVKWVRERAVLDFDPQGILLDGFGTVQDITERKRAEESLRQAQKMESIALLAGGVAHDFNNLLAAILGNASLLRDEVAEESREKLDSVIQATEKAADLTRQLLAYAGRGRFMIESLDVSRVIREMTELMHTFIPQKVDLTLALEPVLPGIEADRGQLQQIVMNLVLNAAEAIGPNQTGAVTVSARTQEVSETAPVNDEITGEPVAPGKYVCLEVKDTGCGMDYQTRTRIFDPFFTTKFLGRGLGLAAVAGIVQSHSGAIQLETEPAKGATFRVLLPGGPTPPAPTRRGSTSPNSLGT